jgi:ferredoxin-type protein NapG
VVRQDNSRREFLLKTMQGSALTATASLGWFYLIQQQAQASPHAVRPPGAESRDEFYARCIKCGQCVQACPFDTLALARSGSYVPVGTPYFVPRQTPCYLCPDIPCQQACPTGAISKQMEKIEDARMGLAVIDIENCLSWQGLRCEICYRECPLKDSAISVEHQPRRMSKHAMLVPLVHSEACTGCGICEKACPTQQAAIRIVPPELVQGKIGEHYRLGWKSETSITQDFKASPDAPAGGSEKPALDYLNQEGAL